MGLRRRCVALRAWNRSSRVPELSEVTHPRRSSPRRNRVRRRLCNHSGILDLPHKHATRLILAAPLRYATTFEWLCFVRQYTRIQMGRTICPTEVKQQNARKGIKLSCALGYFATQYSLSRLEIAVLSATNGDGRGDSPDQPEWAKELRSGPSSPNAWWEYCAWESLVTWSVGGVVLH